MTHQAPTISVVVPAYNVECYVRRCVESALAQTYGNIEVLLVDDGATDSSGVFCDESAYVDSRVLVIHKTNGGPSSARNRGMSLAGGKYLAFVDSDDWIDAKALEVLLQEADKAHADVTLCGTTLVYDDGSTLISPLRETSVTSYVGMDAVRRLYLDFSVWGKLYKRELFDRIRFPEGKLYEDARTQYKVALVTDSIVVVPLALYYYYQRGNSIMGSFSCENYLDRVSVWDEICEGIGDICPEELEYMSYRKNLLVIELVKTMYKHRRILKNREVFSYLVREFAPKGGFDYPLLDRMLIGFGRVLTWPQRGCQCLNVR